MKALIYTNYQLHWGLVIGPRPLPDNEYGSVRLRIAEGMIVHIICGCFKDGLIRGCRSLCVNSSIDKKLFLYRALRVPITSRMLSDVLSRLVETIAEQGEDMQGYVTELFLTLEAVVDALDSDFRPMDLSR